MLFKVFNLESNNAELETRLAALEALAGGQGGNIFIAYNVSASIVVGTSKVQLDNVLLSSSDFTQQSGGIVVNVAKEKCWIEWTISPTFNQAGRIASTHIRRNGITVSGSSRTGETSAALLTNLVAGELLEIYAVVPTTTVSSAGLTVKITY
jgi:hypothetical protein